MARIKCCKNCKNRTSDCHTWCENYFWEKFENDIKTYRMNKIKRVFPMEGSRKGTLSKNKGMK